ncbi:TetR/AcrR family transcriptional regulator [Spirillospora sp. CA-294931]|uniref:TetR/AcrR family transcriptional regulator n=1 Tax=Spirillospora sp. CA-294931 TaxID=3240042 RepID=UPI003D944B24
MTERRDMLADAAIATLAREGMRGLTHRAVDKAASLPEGSCSYYFRTRRSLLQATVERLEEIDTEEFTTGLAPGADLNEIAEAATLLVVHWTTAGRERMLARYELALEANRRPELRELFLKAGARTRALLTALLAAAGTPDPANQARLFAAYLDGLIFDHLAGAGALDLTPGDLQNALLTTLRAFAPDPA